MNDVNHQETELDRILKEASSLDLSEPKPEPRPSAEQKPAQAPKQRTVVKKVSSKPDRGVPIEKRILAGVKANADKKAEEKRVAEEQQAINAQRAALGLKPVEEKKPAAPARKPATSGAKPTTSGAKPATSGAKPATVAEKVAPKRPPVQTGAESAESTQGKKQPKLPKKPKTRSVSGEAAAAKAPRAPKAPKERKPARQLPKAMVSLLVVLSMVSLLWVGMFVHPDTGSATAVAVAKKLDMAEKLNLYMNNAAADALSNLTYIKKIYTIPESSLVAPKPQGTFGSTNDPAEVRAVIDQAAELLDGQTMAWNEALPFWSGAPIQYYYDETILAIAWKEYVNGNMISFSEVKIAHGSQLRRALAGNQYGSSVEEYPTNMASNVNAVLAINGDFYNFRDLGITVYQRKLYRHAPKSVDTAYFTANGDMIFSKRGELSDKAAAEKFVEDNDVVFSVAFGPVLVEDGQKISTPKYPIGEIDKRYSRTAIGQRDQLHYVLMTVNYETPAQVTCTLAQATDYIYEKGVQKAYALDGGQTSSMVFNGKLVNRVDWGNERTMSDIIYFASAVPEGGAKE